MCAVAETWEALRILILESQPRLNLRASLNLSSEAIRPFENISRPEIRSHTITQSRLDSEPSARHLATLSITTDRLRRIYSNHGRNSSSSKVTLQLNNQLGIMTENPPACQSQPTRLNSGGYKDQQI